MLPLAINFKRLHANADTPKFMTPGAAAVDLSCVDYVELEGGYYSYNTGIAIELPPGACAQLFPRSSIYRKNAVLANSIGLIDSDYRGPIIAVFKSFDGNPPYGLGERCCQLVITTLPTVTFTEVSELGETKRGSGGFGSTGAS